MSIQLPSWAMNAQQMHNRAPAIFADLPHSKTTEKYGFVSTKDVITSLAKEGWFPTEAMQSRGKTEERDATNRHYVRLRHVDQKPIMVGDSLPEIVLMNSHNKASGFALSAGLFRLVCSNGMVIADSMFETKKYRHTPNVLDDIIEGTYEVIESVPMIESQMAKFNGLLLNKPKRIELASRTLKAVHGDDRAKMFDLDEVITPNRREDSRPSMWNTLNTIQEGLIRGGLETTSLNNKTRRTRGITSPRQNVLANKAIWETANNFYNELRAA
jgi:hypothetical protein